MDDINLRIPPHDIEAEQSILASMIFDSEAIADATEVLRGDDFYRPDHKAIFEAASELFFKGIPVDAVTLKDKLVEMGVLEQVGGMDYILYLARLEYSSTNARHYAKIVEGKSILRNLIRAASEISKSGYEAREEVGQIVETAEKLIFNIMQNRRVGDFTPIRDLLFDTLENIELMHNSQSRVTGVETGFADFDNKTAGLQRSDLILLAARPSMGKSAIAHNIAQYVGVRNKIPTAIFSLEMSKQQVVNRLLCGEALIDNNKLRTGSLEDSDWEKLANAMNPLSEAPVYIDDTPGITVMEVRAKCRKLKLERGLGLVIIDYLQLMSGGGKTESRQQEISEISRSLKALAREMDAPVMALSQLSRACETRADHRPMLSDLRESGAIEQDADVVCFLYRDEYYFPETDKKNQAELIIAKQRNGATGTVDLTWLGNYTKFASAMRY